MQRWQAIVFDLDDTLYPERSYVLSGFRAVAEWGAAQLGLDAVQSYVQLQALFEAGVRGDTFNRWLTGCKLSNGDNDSTVTETTIATLIEIYRDHIPTLQPFPEALTLLPALAQHYQLGVVSDGYLGVQQRKWAALHLERYFHGVVFSDQWGKTAWKPSTKPFREVLHLLNVQAEQAVYIGDNPRKDFLGAREVGMATIWLKRDGGEYTTQEPPSPAHAPDQVVTSWTALQRILLN